MFFDHRNRKYIKHSLESLIKQRVMGIALGYEELNDHDALRDDSLVTAIRKGDSFMVTIGDIAIFLSTFFAVSSWFARLRTADQDGAAGTKDELVTRAARRGQGRAPGQS